MTTNNHETIPQSFCVAPWIHAHVGANGRRRLCCISNEVPQEFAKIKYDDLVNKENYKLYDVKAYDINDIDDLAI